MLRPRSLTGIERMLHQAVQAQYTPLLANMFCLGQHKIYQNGPNTWVYRDDPVATPGIQAADQLPEAIKVLRAGELSSAPDLTFVFGAKIAGLKCTCLWDSGAAKSFISNSFVKRHNLKVSSVTRTIVLADGTQKQTLGCCKVTLKLQKYHSDIVLNVTELVDGFDVITLGITVATSSRLKPSSEDRVPTTRIYTCARQRHGYTHISPLCFQQGARLRPRWFLMCCQQFRPLGCSKSQREAAAIHSLL
jgi:hypothetical protein